MLTEDIGVRLASSRADVRAIDYVRGQFAEGGVRVGGVALRPESR